jgi:acetyl-CoA carboxylase carboxyltransferase component
MLIVEFEWDDANIQHLAERGLQVDEVDAMLGSRITVIRNKRTGSGDYKFIGRAKGGHLVTIVTARTAESGRWGPVTGRRSSDAEKTIYEN